MPSSRNHTTAAILNVCLCFRKWSREKEIVSLVPESYAKTAGSNVPFPTPDRKRFLSPQYAAQVLEHSLRKKNVQCLVGRKFCPWTFTRLHCGNRSRSNCSLFRGPLLWQPEANSLCGDWHSSLLFISCHGYSDAKTSCLSSYLSSPTPLAAFQNLATS